MPSPKLTKLELQIMETLWTRGSASIREIQEDFPERSRPAYTTVQTTVHRLESKKAVRRVKKVGNFHIFEAAVSRNAAQRKLIDELLALFGGSTHPVMAHLIESGRLTLADVQEAEKTLRKVQRKDKSHDGTICMVRVGRGRSWPRQPPLAVHARRADCRTFDSGFATTSCPRSLRALVGGIAQIHGSLLLAGRIRRAPDVDALFDTIRQPTVLLAIDQISQPFSQSAIRLSSAHTPSIGPTVTNFLPFLAVLWLCGLFAVLLLWSVRWYRISSALRSSIPLHDGRELQALRHVERIGGLRNPIPLLLSNASLEPGIVGIARPTLIWPDGVSRRLNEAQLEAILAHEVWHVRRRDNLFATLHMLVEAVFWFYPLVWWLGARLVEERERACDEEVVALGSDRQVYAESILRVCEFCLGSTLPCVAGVTGADLKKRMVHIMNDRILHNLGFARKLLLTVAATLAVAIPVTFGQFNTTLSRAQSQTENATLSAPVYSSVSIKPSALENGENRTKIMFSLMDGSFVANGVTLPSLIQLAYHVQKAQISGPQDFLTKDSISRPNSTPRSLMPCTSRPRMAATSTLRPC